MDQETVNYIIRYYSALMTENERIAHNYQLYTFKAGDSPDKLSILKERGWIRETAESQALLKNGQEAFEWDTAKRILHESPEKIFINNCPQCHKLARTPQAKQCRHCGHNWHYNSIEAVAYYSEQGGYKCLHYRIDGEYLDEKLEALYPGNRYKGLIPTLVSWMMRKDDEEVVWKRILPDINETTICPILMCPDDNDFSCTLIVAEIEHCGTHIKWSRLGIDTTFEWEAEKVGAEVDWFEQPAAMKFSLADYVTMLDRFTEQMAQHRTAK